MRCCRCRYHCCSLSNGWMICLWKIKAYGSIMACVLFVSFISQIKIFLFRGNSLEFIWNVCRLIQPSIWTKHHWNGNWNNVPCLFLHLPRKRSKNLHAIQINNKFTSLYIVGYYFPGIKPNPTFMYLLTDTAIFKDFDIRYYIQSICNS